MGGLTVFPFITKAESLLFTFGLDLTFLNRLGDFIGLSVEGHFFNFGVLISLTGSRLFITDFDFIRSPAKAKLA